MESMSLVEQIQQANELWNILLWVGGALFTMSLWFIRQIWLKQKDQKKFSIALKDRVHKLEKEVIKDFVTYTVFNTVVKDLKDEIHNSMREVRNELTQINVYLRDNDKK